MSSPWEDVRRRSREMRVVGARPSPLPWMLLTVSIVMTFGVLMLGRARMEEERTRTAAALKATDEVKAQLKASLQELDKAKESCTAGEGGAGDLQKRVSLELTNRRLQEELNHLKATAKGSKR